MKELNLKTVAKILSLIVWLILLIGVSIRTDVFIAYWNNGGWLALCITTVTTSIISLLITQNTVWRSWIFFQLLLAGLSFGLVSLDITPASIKIFFNTPSPNQINAKSLFEDFGIGLISTILTFVTGAVLWSVKEAEEKLKRNIQDLEQTERSVILLALNSKCYGHFNKDLNQLFNIPNLTQTQQAEVTQLQRIVDFLEVNYEEENELLNLLEVIKDQDKTLLFGISASRSYLRSLQDYYADKNKAIVHQCKRLLK